MLLENVILKIFFGEFKIEMSRVSAMVIEIHIFTIQDHRIVIKILRSL